MTKPATNLLPYDGVVEYYEKVFAAHDSVRLFKALCHEITWEHDEVWLFGKKRITARKMAWIAEPGCNYTYARSEKVALPHTPAVREIQHTVEEMFGESFNSCLLNLYHSGDEGMGWHRDQEPTLVHRATIASVSFGAERTFRFKHRRTGEVISLQLHSGSVLLMKGETQERWVHELPKRKSIREPRINLTFRRFIHP